ncbi:predicted nucleic acid-binding protein, containing PIN domain [Thermococcus sibiricus MM 739]|uniref:Predicted nucleic acid-binding protein, containing PIN domain n=1 Tax=Thermococcus sibiricus (strain DSM 12597 / MM 739) TaxID=604354 RepID=C6A193_THESM|nr:predicted nucleic acid-binding protein, containing PIN domain [Thermococcus sibiricus MM 739]
MYEYLLAKAFLGKSPEYEMGLLKEIYSIVPLEDEIIVKAALITNKLLKNRQKMPSSEILVGVTAILKDGLLITEHPEAYNPLRKYGLDVISTEKFIEELNELIVKFSEETSRANVKEPARG